MQSYLLQPSEIAAALLPVPCYTVLESSEPPATCRIPGAIGCTSRTLDVLLKDWLEERGEWVGRRPAIYIADATIAQIAREQATEPTGVSQLHNEILVAAVCHELAHVAESEPDYCQPFAELQTFATKLAAYSLSIAEQSPYPPFFGHGPHFIRAAVHLAYRAEKLGWRFCGDFLFDGNVYGLTDASRFAYALDREPACLAEVSIFEIRKFRAPMLFVRLWQECVNAWIDQQPADTAGAAMARRLLNVTFED
jgi:hypothetical protein